MPPAELLDAEFVNSKPTQLLRECIEHHRWSTRAGSVVVEMPCVLDADEADEVCQLCEMLIARIRRRAIPND